MRRPNRLAAKTVIPISLFLSVFLMLLTLVMRIQITGILVRETQRRLEDITLLFAEINSLPFERTDYYALENNTKELLKQDGIVDVAIYDVQGAKLTVSEPNDPNLPERYRMSMRRDIVDRYGQRLGWLRVEISIRETYAAIARAQGLLFSLIGGTIALIILVLAGIFRRMINAPLNSLLTSVSRVADGDLDEKAAVFAEDEIGDLAQAFNQMTETLQENVALVRNIVGSMPSILISLDTDMRVTQWNREAETFTGIPASRILGRELWSVTSQFIQFKDECQMVMSTGRTVELFRIPFGGEERQYKDIAIFPLIGDGVRGVVMRVDDVTEIMTKEAQLRQAQKMESIGNLAGGFAHDFNNVLAGILGTMSLIEYDLQDREMVEKSLIEDNLGIISESAHRATEMVGRLLSISRKTELSFSQTDLGEIAKRVTKICSNTFDKSVHIELSVPDGQIGIHADPGQIEQVLLNLCINAEHAMTIMRADPAEVGGRLGVTISRIYADEFFCTQHSACSEQEYWVIEVADTGIGMDKRTLERIFDPFFSTKAKGHGTGLGLSMVFNIVEQHEGFITTYSQPGEGSIFRVYLPVSDAKSGSVSTRERREELPRGTGTVLVIDDENIMRLLARRILNEAGYEVIEAADGERGIEIYTGRGAEIDFVLLDLAMPGISGVETYRRLKGLDPDVRVLMTSGFGSDRRIKQALEEGVRGFIQKPFSLFQLATKAREILES